MSMGARAKRLRVQEVLWIGNCGAGRGQSEER